MKATDRSRMLGAVVGKALELFDPRDAEGQPLASGRLGLRWWWLLRRGPSVLLCFATIALQQSQRDQSNVEA